MRPKNKDPYSNNSQEIRSGVPAARSTNNGDLGFQITQEKMEKKKGENSLASRGRKSTAPATNRERG